MTAVTAGLALLTAVTLALGPAAAAGAGPALVAGTATATGVFITYLDKETFIEGGTVVPPDLAAPLARAGIDRSGRGDALAALGYSPYVEAPGLVNAFGGTELPLGQLSEGGRAKVSGAPPQSATAPQAEARLADGPRAEATAEGVGAAGETGVQVRLGRAQAAVDTATGSAESMARVLLENVAIGEQLRIEAVTLSVLVRQGPSEVTDASTVVTGLTVGGVPVRMGPGGLEPTGTQAPDLEALRQAGIEVLAGGHHAAGRTEDGDMSGSAVGPRIRWTTADGRRLEITLGQAQASSAYGFDAEPPAGQDRPAAAEAARPEPQRGPRKRVRRSRRRPAAG